MKSFEWIYYITIVRILLGTKLLLAQHCIDILAWNKFSHQVVHILDWRHKNQPFRMQYRMWWWYSYGLISEVRNGILEKNRKCWCKPLAELLKPSLFEYFDDQSIKSFQTNLHPRFGGCQTHQLDLPSNIKFSFYHSKFIFQ